MEKAFSAPLVPADLFWDDVLQAIPDGITIVSGSGQFLYANRTAARLCGFESPEEMLAAGLEEVWKRFEFLDVDGRPASREELPGRQALRDGAGPVTSTVRYRDLITGEDRWSQVNAIAVRMPVSGDLATLNVIADVTAQMKSEQTLAFLAGASQLLSESLDFDEALASIARLAVPHISDWCSIDIKREDGTVETVAVAHVDPAKVEYARQLQSRYPFDPTAATGVAAVLRTGEPELISAVSEEMLAALALDEELVDIVRELRLSTAMTVPLRFRGDALGAVTFVGEEPRHFTEDDMALAADLGRRAGLALENAALYREAQQATAQLEAMLAQITDAIIVADSNGIVSFANEAADLFFGGVEVGSPVQGSRPHALFLTMSGEQLTPEQMYMTRAARGETIMNDLWRVRVDGEGERILQTSAAPLLAEDGRQFGAVTVSRDVTAQHQFDQQKDAFLLAASHDLKNPLTLVKGTAQLLEQRAERAGDDDEQLLDGLRRIASTATRMSDMVNEMLDISRVQMGRPLALDIHSTNLVELLDRCAEEARGSSERNPIEFERPERPVEVEIDGARIERVVQNLLSNAAKFSQENQLVRLRLAEDGEWVIFAVDDEGVGIPPEDITAIFDQFRRGANVLGKVGGSGIGLAGARQIVEAHGGEITVQSKLDKGSSFIVRLPRHQPTTGEG